MLKYILIGLAVLFIVLAVFASNIGSGVKNIWSNAWCTTSSSYPEDEFGETPKSMCKQRVADSTEMGSSICIVLIAAVLISYAIHTSKM